MIFRANDKYRAFLRSSWIASPPATTLQVTALPANLPTLVTVGWGASYETVFSVMGKSGDNPSNYALTGVTRVKGAETNIPTDATINCLNNEEFFNQFIPYVSMNFRGDYDSELEYSEGDVVYFEGSSYVAKTVTTSEPSGNDWILIARIGASIKEAEFDGDDIVFTLTDDSTVRLENAKLELKGDQGIQGLASTITIGTVTTGEPESDVEVTNTGTETDAILNFTIPEGRVGSQGVPGETGPPGISIIDPTSLKNATLIEDTTNTDDYEGEVEIDNYFVGLKINLKVTNANTGSSTLNVSNLGAKSIKKNVIDDLEADDIKAGQILPLIYDGTNFQIVGGGGSGSGGGSASYVQNETPSGTIDGVNDEFELNASPIDLQLYLNGVRQKETVDYTLSGSTISFVLPPLTNDLITADYLVNIGSFEGSSSFVSNEVPLGVVDGSNDTFTLNNTPVSGTLALYRDGQLLKEGGDYTLDDDEIVFTSPPEVNSVLLAFYQQALASAGNADTLDGQHLSGIIDLIYPVGAIYITTVSTNPGTYLGGTWTAFGAGKTLVGYDSEDSDFNASEKTGGAKTHQLTISEMPEHTHTQNAHSHTATHWYAGGGSQPCHGMPYSATGQSATGQIFISNTTATNQNTGGDGAHNNLQPYITCFMWKRVS